MKKVFCLLMVFILFSTYCFADETKEQVEMTLEEAIDYALKNNSTIIDIEKNVKDQEKVFDDARMEYFKWKSKIKRGYFSFENETEYLTSFGQIYELSKLQYDKFLADRKGTKLQVEYSVKNMIYSMFNTKDAINLLEKSIEKQENDVEIAEVKYKLNMITENELSNTKATLETTKLNLKNTKEGLKSLEISLKQIMGFDVSEELVLKRPEYTMDELIVEDLSKTIEDSMATNSSVISAKIQYKQKENNYILATKTSFLSKDEKKEAKDNYKDAEFRLNNEINSIKENLSVLYSQVKDKEKEINIAKDEMDRAKNQFEQAKVMYDVGLISKNSYFGYEIAVINSENTYNSKIKDGILLKDRFSIAISTGDIIAK